MSKISKLIKNPKAFFRDAIKKRFPKTTLKAQLKLAQNDARPTAILIGFSSWKTWIKTALKDRHCVTVLQKGYTPTTLIKSISQFKSPKVYSWSYQIQPQIAAALKNNGIPLYYVEDGFLRGLGFGVAKTPPLSLVYDEKAMHFDRHKVTQLDEIINEGNFTQTQINTAKEIIHRLKSGLTKYMVPDNPQDLRETLNLDPKTKTIVILGQIEDDLSLKFGMEEMINPNDLVVKIALENPDAQILYRPHPEALNYPKKHYSNPKAVENICHIIDSTWSIKQTLDVADEAHTMTSLTGLEAAAAGLEVHTYGMPFYAGWGFTTDHGLSDVPGKRIVKRTLEEVIAGAYICYSKYYNPITSEEISVEEALEITKTLEKHILRNTLKRKDNAKDS